MENVRQIDKFIPEWLFKEEQTPVKKKIKEVYDPKTLKHKSRSSFKLNDKNLEKK